MTVRTKRPVTPAQPADEQHDLTDFDLDITIVRAGPAADRFIAMSEPMCNPGPDVADRLVR
ncbi:FxLD family lanthipeptide [Embleya sp. NPDC001921]